MACDTIKSFTYDSCQPNLGGVKKVWLANYEEDAAIVSDSGETKGIITGFTSGVTWVEYPFRKNTASMTSTLNVGDEGSSYVSTDLNLVFSRMDTPKRLAVVALALGECMAVIQDANDTKWFLGKNNPMACSAGTGETGTQKGDANHYTVTLTDDSLEYPHQVDDSVKLV